MVLSIITNCFSVFAGTEYSTILVQVDNNTRHVEIKYELLQPVPDVSVTTIIIIPTKTVDDITTNAKVVCYMDTKKTDLTGKTIFEYTLPENAVSGYYTVSCGATGYTPAKQQQFYYSSPASILAAKDSINKAIEKNSAEDLENSIITYFRQIQIEEAFEVFNNPAFGIDRISIIKALLAHGFFSTLDEVKNIFDEKVAVDAVNLSNSSNVMNAVAANNKRINARIVIYDEYQNEKDRELVRRVLKNKVYQTASSIRDAYNEAITLVSINNCAWQNLWVLILENNTVIDLPTTKVEKYNLLKNKEKVMQALKNAAEKAPFESYQLLRKAFGDAVDNQANVESDAADVDDNKVKTSKVKISGGSYSGGIIPETQQENPNTIKVFSDIEEIPWAKESILFLADKKIVNGDEQGKFNPSDSVTREQFVKMLILSFGLEDSTAEANFPDVVKNQWYYPYIASAKKAGIVNGFENGNFGINSHITRQEMALMAYRASKISGKIKFNLSGNIEFADKKDILESATESIIAMKNAGIIAGMEDNTFAPTANASRAQAAKIIYGLLKLQN